MAPYGNRASKSLSKINNPVKKQSILKSILNYQIGGSSQTVSKNLTVPQNDLLVFFRQLAVILQSGVPLAQGLDLLSENMTNKKFGICVRNISKNLSAGEDLSSSLMQYPKVFPPITIGLIQAGEAGGILSEVLDRVASLIEAQAKLKSEIQGALIYPVIVLVLAISVSLGLLIFIVPTFKEMFDGFGADLPALTSFMLLLSKIVTSIGFFIGAPIAILTFSYLFSVYYSSKQGRILVDRLILKIPLFGDLILRSEMAALCDTLSTLVNSGIPLVEGLERCIAASGNQVIKNSISKAITLVQQGQELSYSLSISKDIPRLLISMIKIGEETGALSFMLENLSNFYKREVEETVSALTKAMEPTVILVVAGIVGTIVVALYLPMFALITEMG